MIETESQEKPRLKTLCPWCGLKLRVGLDKKGRPFFRCWKCEVRFFGTDTTFETFEKNGLIWKGKRSMESLREWLKRVSTGAGLRMGKE